MSLNLPPRSNTMLDAFHDFEVKGNLGFGAYSTVDLILCKRTQSKLALKKVRSTQTDGS